MLQIGFLLPKKQKKKYISIPFGATTDYFGLIFQKLELQTEDF